MMFFHVLLKTLSRARCLWLAGLVGLLATSLAAASAEASTARAGDAVIASATGTAIDTTSSSTAAPGTPSGRSSSRSPGNVLTLNPSVPTTGGPSRAPVARTPSASQVDPSSLEAPIVGSPGRRQTSPVSRAALAQIESSGPIVASSGSASVTRHATDRRIRRASPASFMTGYRREAPKTPVPVSSTVEINAPGVHVFISPTSARRPSAPGSRPASANPAVVQQIGTPGAGLAGLLPSAPRPVPAPGGPANTTLFGNAPGPAGGSSLLGIDALFTIAVLLVGAAWRRRSWDLPVLPSQSALLSLALDRPG